MTDDNMTGSGALPDGRTPVLLSAHAAELIAVSYTHLTLPTNREV